MIRVYLTGRIAVEAEGEIALREASFRGRQERLAFAYLACERARPVPREELAMLLWPEGAPPAWSTALSALMSHLRTLLAAGGLGRAGATITRGFGQHQMLLPADVWVDLEAAAHAIDTAEGALRANDLKRAFGPATVAATIARRPFLAGDESAWAGRERERLARNRVRALECLADVFLANGEPALAVEQAQQALALEPFRESAYRLLMRSHALAATAPRDCARIRTSGGVSHPSWARTPRRRPRPCTWSCWGRAGPRRPSPLNARLRRRTYLGSGCPSGGGGR